MFHCMSLVKPDSNFLTSKEGLCWCKVLVILALNLIAMKALKDGYLENRMDCNELSVHGYGKNLRYQMCPEKVCDQLVYTEVSRFHPHLG